MPECRRKHSAWTHQIPLSADVHCSDMHAVLLRESHRYVLLGHAAAAWDAREGEAALHTNSTHTIFLLVIVGWNA